MSKMFASLNTPQSYQLIRNTEMGIVPKYNPITDHSRFLSGEFAVVCIDTKSASAIECCSTEAIHRAVHLASGDPERQVVIVPRAELGQP